MKVKTINGQRVITHKGAVLSSYSEIIDYALKLKEEDQRNFVKAYARTGKYALSNIGYFAGYYGPRKYNKILKVFKTAHPVFGGPKKTKTKR